MRADKLLHQLGLFESRKKAQVAIDKKLVALKRDNKIIPVKKSSDEIEPQPGDEWQITPDAEFKYVSRSGLKLEGALEYFKPPVAGAVCLDIGLSTGGFSQCLLQYGAAKVFGVDVGQNQLHPKLQTEKRLEYFDKINAREKLQFPEGTFDLIVADVSFISILKVLEPQLPLLKKGGKILALIKPQFEAGPGALDKKGVIGRDPGLLVMQKTVKSIESFGLQIFGTQASLLVGEDGNQEFFVYCGN
jgi:23S rRNA (cytidine1920-2'-O)/16S rRNA (cytidine1409-2'-O)-methyltransferase